MSGAIRFDFPASEHLLQEIMRNHSKELPCLANDISEMITVMEG